MKKNEDFTHLTSDEYHVLREAGTEKPWSGEYNNHYEDGIYSCRGCEQQLFRNTTKFDSGCGWPSFDEAIQGTVVEKEDQSMGMVRVEVLCSNCESHLGHLFPDGPAQTTGMRYCMNSLSLKFEKT